jgi:hypothetical protein
MRGDDNRGNRPEVSLISRTLLVLIVWGFALSVMFLWRTSGMPSGLLIAALGEEGGLPVWWSQPVICIVYAVITWALLVYSRPVVFFVLCGILTILLLLNILLLIGVVGAAEQRFFP